MEREKIVLKNMQTHWLVNGMFQHHSRNCCIIIIIVVVVMRALLFNAYVIINRVAHFFIFLLFIPIHPFFLIFISSFLVIIQSGNHLHEKVSVCVCGVKGVVKEKGWNAMI
jgi:hypothetical protein